MLLVSLLLFLLQDQPRLSKVVIVFAALALVGGVVLVVYFYRRFKASDKEPEEDWQSGMRALFVEPGAKADGGSAAPVLPGQVSKAAPIAQNTEAQPTPSLSRPDTPQPAPPVVALPRLSGTEIDNKLPAAAEPPLIDTKPPAAPVLYETTTQALSSQGADREEASPFDEDVLAGLETAVQPPANRTIEASSVDGGRTRPFTPPDRTSQVRAPRGTEPFDAASTSLLRNATPRVREPWEPPSIRLMTHREPYEPPSIRPLDNREQPAQAIRETRPSRPAPHEILQPKPELAAQPAAPEMIGPAPLRAGASGSHAPAGSVLGLPAGASSAPLRLGTPARARADVGIGALANYGKDTDPVTSRAGTVVLLVVVVVVAAAGLSYMFLPAIHSRVNHVVARMRGVDDSPPEAVVPAKAMVWPSRNPEVVKNMARGAVDNTTTSQPTPETLENLSVEISLERGNGGAAEVRSVAVNPPSLAPGQRGLFEFEYDGKRDTGFTGYKILKLKSGDSEIKFTTPNQNR